MKEYLKEKVWQQTIAGAFVLLAFPFVYIGSQHGNTALIFLGIAMILIGVVATPLITFIHKRKEKKEKE